jgi:hypothetical protein
MRVMSVGCYQDWSGTDDTIILLTHTNTTKFNSNTHMVFETINTWLKNNYHSANFEKNLVLFTLKLGTVQLLT